MNDHIEALVDSYVESLKDDEIPPTLPEPRCPICRGAGAVYTEELHPYGMGTAAELLWEPCECVWGRAPAHAILEGVNADPQVIWTLHSLLIGRVEFYGGYDIVYTHKDAAGIVAVVVDDTGYPLHTCTPAATTIEEREAAHKAIDGGFNESDC